MNVTMELIANQAGSGVIVPIMGVKRDPCTATEKGSSYEENSSSITGMCCYLSSASYGMRWKFAEYIIFTIADRDVNTDSCSYDRPNEATDCKTNRRYRKLDCNLWDTTPGWASH